MRRTIARTAAALAVSAGLVATGPAAAAAVPVPRLLEPTGAYSVGVTQLHLVDEGRPDPWVPEVDRELMVALWYPTAQDHGPTAGYLTPEEARLFLIQSELDLPPNLLSDVETHAYPDARPLRGKKPLVVLSPGFNKPRAILTGVAEQLASEGFLVAVISHNYESVLEFPDGRTTTCRACGTGEFAKAQRGRAQDVRFVLDELTGRGPWKSLIDTRRIAMGGHSLGGASSFAAMRLDPRIKAGLNVDGNIDEMPDMPLGRPFMLMGHEGTAVNNPTWTDAWGLSTGWKRWLEVTGTEHASFTDVGLLGSQLGLPMESAIDPVRATELTRAYVSAFFAEHLGCGDGGLLDGPSADWPEVVFHG
ncbi:alpha/beta hydrolase family protein [Phytomonospora endophytica]|uniref:Putative dienelactone hydrolase n=1 Tax=Phytomonospora endophytica TaxID=714109 RepID=A0A841FC79_9ACTN|nr:alpha/beta hydrolase [Phytomonospora endophytica]MBB6033394.1 putative dienelactone hydrolase [Phytomonospora endophytica]GIG70835.1 hypothetical protein Pen01_71300 [Phytomonospora endophytica]